MGPTSTATKQAHAVSIRQTFTLPICSGCADANAETSGTHKTVVQTFDFTTTEPATLGLPPSKTPTKAEPGSYAYTGLHDHGPFVPPREGGDFALLVGCADEARKASDRLLTKIIEEEKERARNGRKRDAGDL